jgi:predicted lipoprotein with Yx(FWY)xxD motif
VSRTISAATVVLALGSAVALAACGGTASGNVASARPAAAPPASSSTERAAAPLARSSTGSGTAASAAASVKTGSSKYGKVLFDGGGRALYVFASDRGKASTCYGGCAAAWPPFTVNRAAKAGAGVRGSLLGTTRRRDGRLQVTYAGHPLYYFTGDIRPGQITCQNVSSFGGLWLVVNPNGTPVH